MMINGKECVAAPLVSKLIGESTKLLRGTEPGRRTKGHGCYYWTREEVENLVEKFAPEKLSEIDSLFQEHTSESALPVVIESSEIFGHLRRVAIDGQLYFVAKDAAAMLGYVNTRGAVQDHVSPDDRLDGVGIFDGVRGVIYVTLINERGMFSLVFGSHLERAKEYSTWILDIIHRYVRDGIAVNPAKIPDMFAQKLAEARQILDIAKSLTPEEISVLEMTGTMEEKILAAAKLSKHSDITL